MISADQAARYDALMQRLERRFFPDTRAWVCGRARGDTLEVAVGTGLNLPHYPDGIRLTALDREPAVLDFARRRAHTLGREVRLDEGDAAALPFPDESFDTVVATFVLCEVADDAHAIREALRVLRPGGSLVLADHVVATNPLVKVGQHLLEALTIPLSGEHFTRRPSTHVTAAGAEVVSSDRFTHGAIERLHAHKPAR
nr:class I SAM-dependent methyltransferase [Propionicimonas sp.]